MSEIIAGSDICSDNAWYFSFNPESLDNRFLSLILQKIFCKYTKSYRKQE